ncbi:MULTISPECIES: 3'-5' exonuclease [Rhodanobacter]|uniref:3'-5' exonuclease n=1 Tax=Rhodanobacter TaxID=75309 RepID=UPI0002E7E8D7|nr:MULTISPECIES: 3'-5' exonuclease [Rhodanobacter]UJJ52194.1 NERD domain-containing protein [Rhodanobacter denitrificans]UJJ59026.1 NERD domain-containing protein [Rhodanobacter denitrificans]UJM89489.1 NERD domain-containing protein [Rhodanobacter denitrificans]UJM94941.1 NERD domain-containing protein [Rhodanobacter denitrificans]UJM98471.1 NERD domain-containing protein [Rhodanobacter denitrificans]
MATLIPTRNSCLPRMTGGEKRVSERLEQKLEDDYLLWYDVPVGLKQRHPDFVVFHPRRGLLVLEVKDWKADTLRHADSTQFTLVTERGLVKENNPLLQARAYALEIGVVLERDPALRHPEGSRYAGKLIMPWGWGVVLANITRKQFDEGALGEVLPEHLVICRDELYETVDAEAFQQRLWAMFPQVYPVALTLPQIDRVRWHLFPELRVEAGSGQFGLFGPTDAAVRPLEIPDLVKVMDAQQEQLARSIGGEHRIIHGVAGSGKTMILGFRAMQLARELSKPILVLCYNKTLAARLEQLIGERGLSEKVQVYNFHKWCRKMLVAYHEPLPPGSGKAFVEALPPAVIAGVDRGRIPRAQYGAVLVDEGHDFEPDWYKLIVQMIDPVTNSLLVLYDDAQNIYGNPNRRRISWKSLGVQAQGRTTILKLNYRNTLEILSVARTFAQDLLASRSDDADGDGVPLVAPESAGRRGAVPELVRTDTARAQMDVLIARLRDEHAHGRPYSEMAVIYRNQWEGEKLHEVLGDLGIPSRLADNTGKQSLFAVEDSVKLVTMHSSKGLEFPFVIIPGIGGLPKEGQSEADEARLLYVAMTRATEHLLLIHHLDSMFSRRIRDSINEVTAQLERG